MLDVSRAEKEFGFRAKTHFEEALKKTIEYYISTKQTKETKETIETKQTRKCIV